MMGWVTMGILSAALLAALIRFGRLPRRTWEAVAAAIVLGLVGYSVQGSPGYEAAPARSLASNSKAAEAMILARSEMDRTFSPARPYLIASDAWARDGDYKLAAAYIRSGIRKNPREADLWAGLGLQLMLAGEGRMSPPAEYAFDQARKYNPRQPAPDYFKGLVLLFEGRPDLCLQLWQALLDNAPKEAKWKPRVEAQVAGLKSMLQQSSARRQ
ncbi:tetratricopeptide repeat protein [Sphingorhabdus arenilitoris]|uniref:Tetratricopeptide repeat protein n=1 Tax=Sphingorhabdus arenilitoris TaxID=1490041 RepID=A0ABV8RET1_9SPHN